MVIWDGVSESFAVSTSYLGPNDLLYGHGNMVMEKNRIIRSLTVNYSEGQYMPFLKRTAGKGGFPMLYRQIWNIKDENTFEGQFEVFVNGEYIDPFNKPATTRKELWKKIN